MKLHILLSTRGHKSSPSRRCRAMSDSDVELHESSSEEADRCKQNVSLQREIKQILSKLDDEEAVEKKQLDALRPLYRLIPKELKLKPSSSFFAREGAAPSKNLWAGKHPRIHVHLPFR